MSRRPTSPCSARRSSPASRSCWDSFRGSPRGCRGASSIAGPISPAATAAWLCWRSPGRLQSGCAGTSSPAIRGIRLAHVWGFATPLLQGAALFGVYGLGMLTFLVLAAPTAGWRASIAALLVVGLAGWAGQSAMAAIDSGSGPLDPHRAAQRAAGAEMASGNPHPAGHQAGGDEPPAGLRSPVRRGLARDGAAGDHRARIGSTCGHGPGGAAGRPAADRRGARHGPSPRTACGTRCWWSTGRAPLPPTTTRSTWCRSASTSPSTSSSPRCRA